MLVWVGELVAAGILVPGAVVPADGAYDGLPADPAPLALALLAGHVVAAAILLCLEGATRASLHPEFGCVQPGLPCQASLILLAGAVLLVRPGVVVAEVSAASLTMHLRHGPAVGGQHGRHEPAAARALTERGVRLLPLESPIFLHDLHLIGKELLELLCASLGHRLLVPTSPGDQAHRAEQLLHAAVLHAAPEVHARAGRADAVHLVAAVLEDEAIADVRVLKAHRAAERIHRLQVPREGPGQGAARVQVERVGVAAVVAVDNVVAAVVGGEGGPAGERREGPRGTPPKGHRSLAAEEEALGCRHPAGGRLEGHVGQARWPARRSPGRPPE
mmetsp:Transcript_102407/g.285367  ORF Transcript_102407/g.285367 Transcript_102407/m.285367 type:complete len:332 (+) Transcript_102407:551-1546(+)